MPRNDAIILEDVRVLPRTFRNFSGNDDSRFFNIELKSQEQIDILEAAGIDVKTSKPREDHPEWEPMRFVKVKVYWTDDEDESWKNSIVNQIISGTNERRVLDGNHMKALDMVPIIYADVSVRPYNWTYGKGNLTKTGIGLTLNEGNFVIQENRFARPFEDKDYSGIGRRPAMVDYESDELPFGEE